MDTSMKQHSSIVLLLLALIAICFQPCYGLTLGSRPTFLLQHSSTTGRETSPKPMLFEVEASDTMDSATATMSRREILSAISILSMTMGLSATATHAATDTTTTRTTTGPLDGNLVDLPSEAVRSYLQYRGPLQTSTDFYLFDLKELLQNVNEWGLVGELFQVSNARGGQGSPNRIERDFTNTMRIISLSMPPSDEADDMVTASLQFAGAMQKISKATAGIRRDLPVEIDAQAVPDALRGWEEGRVAFNTFLLALNRVTGLDEMMPIPESGPNQKQQYGRSERRYLDLKKKIKLCQNRGGPTLSQAWGQLMVSGYMQDSCGIPDLNDYFYQ